MNTKEKKQTAADDSTTNLAGLIVKFTNSTGQGYVTLAGWTNGDGSPPTSAGNPPLTVPAVATGDTKTIINVIGGSYTEYTYPYYTTFYSNTSGTSTWNMPNGTTLTIEWLIDPLDSSNNYCYFKNLDPSYTLNGSNSYTESNGTYTYDVTLVLNS